ncbi:hypothetical protein B296_00058529 [Ensete ventricosum]|uniref:Uncharacterized protein n=1 Tax=Ensete ventricosum TaxID=4639 RepID=A0A426WZT2_ENSVE|nr:hypothetical protein B296_00058529 [Ensete ventricosum]
MLRPEVTREWVGEGELLKEQTQSEVAETLPCAGRGHTLRDQRLEMDYFSAYIRLRELDKSEDKAEGVEAGGRKGQGSDDESRGAQLPKSKVSVRKEIDSEECHSVAKADLPIAKKGTRMQGNG